MYKTTYNKNEPTCTKGGKDYLNSRAGNAAENKQGQWDTGQSHEVDREEQDKTSK